MKKIFILSTIIFYIISFARKKKILLSFPSLTLIIIFFLFTAYGAFAAEAELEGNYPPIGGVEASGGLIPYIRYVFLYGLATIGLAALIALVIGGLMYMSAGSITKTDEAKKYIWGAITGLLLGLSAYLILNTINPDLVNLKINLEPVNLPPVENDPVVIETCPSGRNKPECHLSQKPPFEIKGCTNSNTGCQGTRRRELTCGADGCWSTWPNWNDIECAGCTGSTPPPEEGNKTYCPRDDMTYTTESACNTVCNDLGGRCAEPPPEAPAPLGNKTYCPKSGYEFNYPTEETCNSACSGAFCTEPPPG